MQCCDRCGADTSGYFGSPVCLCWQGRGVWESESLAGYFVANLTYISFADALNPSQSARKSLTGANSSGQK
jgi:hypothetical protein